MDSTVSTRQAIERQIVSRIIDDAIAAGYSLSVYDGRDVAIHATRNKADILGAMFSVDEEHLVFHKDGRRAGWVYLVYGNEGWDVVCDNTTNLEEVLAGATALANQLCDQAD